MPTTDPHARDTHARAEVVRRFNRFYTKHIGILNEGLLHSPFSLTDVRVLHEIADHGETTATAIAEALDLDSGYLSRILRRFEADGLIEREPALHDGRQHIIRLTGDGRATYIGLNARAHDEIVALLNMHSARNQERLVTSMQTIEAILDRDAKPGDAPYLIRTRQPGDIGWMLERHGTFYTEAFGWAIEALAAEVVADIAQHYDPDRERFWIAEMDGERVGSVCLIAQRDDPEHVAQLRLLLVSPEARGHGIGGRLVQECTRFARRVGYRKITLWTVSVLAAARYLYQREGYRLVAEEPYYGYGPELTAETWELTL